MFEPVTSDFAILSRKVYDVFLDRVVLDNGELEVRLVTNEGGQDLVLNFFDTIGLTYMEECYDSNGGQIIREEGPVPLVPLSRALNSNTLTFIRNTVPKGFDETVEDHAHFVVQTRTETLSFVANKSVAFSAASLNRIAEKQA
ncbi:MAG: hypothetical protein ACP5DX_13910 [Paracoccaceae bacterium]